ncbi:MAG: hypothetical protein ACI808_002939 [Paraglaciecola sp.]
MFEKVTLLPSELTAIIARTPPPMQYPFTHSFIRIIAFLMTCVVNGSFAQEWQLEKGQGDITVFSFVGESGYKDVLAKTTLKSDLSALLRLLDDVEFAPNWIANSIQVKILEAASPDERLVHTFFNAPWPIRNRDMVTYSKTVKAANSIQINIVNKGNEYPTDPDYVRMQDMFGVWKVSDAGDKKITISYQGGGNPSGMLPHWMANKALIDATFDTFVKLSEVILLEKYQSP